MKRNITVALLALTVLVFVGTALGARVTMMNLTPISSAQTIASTAACTTGSVADWIRGSTSWGVTFYAETVNTAILSVIPTLQYKRVPGGAWQSLTMATADAGDTWTLAVDGYIYDSIPTLQAEGAAWYNNAFDYRFIWTGKDAGNNVKKCTYSIWRRD